MSRPLTVTGPPAWFGGRRSHPLLLAIGVAVISTVTGILEGMLSTSRAPALALCLPILFLVPVLLWLRPDHGVLLLLGAAVFLEQFDYDVGPRRGSVTARIPFFHAPAAGIFVTPAELLLMLLILMLVLRQVRDRRPVLPRTTLSRSLLALVGLTAFYVVVGGTRHGDVKMALWELRPFVYLTVAYLLAASLLATERAVRAILWTLVVASGVKAAYGVTIWWSVRSLRPRPEAVLAHEESFFFGLFIFLTIGLWVFGQRGMLRRVATTLFPIVLLADMCNSRRTAWAILLVGSLVLGITAYASVPERRRVLRRVAVVVALLASIYFPAFWSSNGTLGQPARAVRSVVAPDPRDLESNQYRYVENANLLLNIQAHKSTGTGFGVPIVYAIPIVDLRGIASGIAYIPHNTLLWIWMRTGVVGEGLFLFVVASGIAIACRLTAVAADRDTVVLGAVTVSGLVGYVIMGNQDLGFFWFRMALCVGILVGTVEARLRVSSAQGELTPAWAVMP